MIQTITKGWDETLGGFYYEEEQDIVYINQDRLTDEERLQLIRMVDFKYYLTDEVDEDGQPLYALLDLQEGNLGDIESDRFTSLDQALERLDVYFMEGYEWVTDDTYAKRWTELNTAC